MTGLLPFLVAAPVDDSYQGGPGYLATPPPFPESLQVGVWPADSVARAAYWERHEHGFPGDGGRDAV